MDTEIGSNRLKLIQRLHADYGFKPAGVETELTRDYTEHSIQVKFNLCKNGFFKFNPLIQNAGQYTDCVR